jgi:hypothetical protein
MLWSLKDCRKFDSKRAGVWARNKETIRSGVNIFFDDRMQNSGLLASERAISIQQIPGINIFVCLSGQLRPFAI